MKNHFVLKVALMTAGCFVLSAVFGHIAGEESLKTYWQNVGKSFVENSGNTIAVEDTFEAKGVSELVLISDQIDIKIEKSLTDNFGVSYLKAQDDAALQPEIGNGSAVFNLNKMAGKKDFKVNFSGSNFGITIEDASAKILVPASVKKIRIKTQSADVKINGLDLEDVAIESISGNTKTESVHVSSVQHQSISGDLKIVGDVSSLKSHTVSGDIKFVSSSLNPQIRCATTSGDVRVTFAREPNIVLKFDTTSGGLRFDKGGSRTEIDGSIKDLKFGKGAGNVEIQTVSGNLEIAKQE